MKKTTLSLATLVLLSQATFAQNQFSLDTLEVTASQGTNLETKDVPDSVTIITKEAIEESRVTNLAQALNRLGNIAVTQNGGMGTSASMFVRGMDTSRTLVLIDGVRYNNLTAIGGAAEFSQIMLYDVEQIEIIKGAQSGVWGADASAGVINIVTSRAKQGLSGSANIEYGSFDTITTSLQAAYATQEFDILIGGSVYNTDGFSAVEPQKGTPNYGKRYDDLGLEKDSYNNKSLNVKLGWNITDNDRLSFTTQTINSLVKYDDSVYDFTTGISTPTDSTIPQTTLKNRFYSLNYHHTDAINDINLQYNLSTFDRDIVGSFGNSAYKGSVNEIKLDDKINYLENSFVRFGASYQDYKQEELTANTDKSYNAVALFVTNYNKIAPFAIGDTIITESLRYDKYDAFDTAITGKLGIKQYVYNDIYFSTNIGTGFNAPTLGQLYGQYSPNPDLEPETSLTTEVTLGNDLFWVTGFYNEVDNLIEYGVPMYTNVKGISRFKGVEVNYQDYFFDTLGINAAYTYLETKNANGVALARRPKHQVDANIVYYVDDNWDLGLNGQFIGKRYDAADNQGAQTGDYAVANFVTNIKVNDIVTFYGKVDNISDIYYQTVDGYATAGRSLYLGINAKY
ncbi:MAG TPA: TonB-dependent receptor [Helicobacteraceae bacterium]|nr:TonB-dependent receptor [Helicobacteraceae bacterium]